MTLFKDSSPENYNVLSAKFVKIELCIPLYSTSQELSTDDVIIQFE